jgi:hypothetical protein
MNPHNSQNHLFIYDYFDGTYETDLNRFPSRQTIIEWMNNAGFIMVRWKLVERIREQYVGNQVLGTHFLQKHSCTLLALLTDEAYAAGIARIETALSETSTNGKPLIFKDNIFMELITGHVRKSGD